MQLQQCAADYRASNHAINPCCSFLPVCLSSLCCCCPQCPQCLITRGLIPLLAEGSARATDTDTTDEILAAAIEHAKRARYCAKGDSIVALHRIGNASVIKIVDIK